MSHLWEVTHAYYCNADNYYSNDCSQTFSSIDSFLEEEIDADIDYNLVFRWDWEEKVEEESTDACVQSKRQKILEDDIPGKLSIFFMGQRKGQFRSVSVSVTRKDEAKVIQYLKPRWEYLQALWKPLTPSVITEKDKKE